VPQRGRAPHATTCRTTGQSVRSFVLGLGRFRGATVVGEPPNFETLLTYPDATRSLSTGAERLPGQAWYGGYPIPRPALDETQESAHEIDFPEKGRLEKPPNPKKPARRHRPPAGDTGPAPVAG